MELILNVNGMTCGHCKASVEQVVSKIDGVDSIKVDLDNKEVIVVGNNLDEDKIKQAIDDIGFDVL